MSRILYPAEEAAEQLGIGLTTVRALIKAGDLRSVKIGSARRISAEALQEYVRQLDAEQNGDGAAVPAAAPSEAPTAIHS